jgi:hypothetical protein
MQIPILQYLDVLIGFAVVMIIVATFVTAVTQFILSITYARARYLREGIRTLVEGLDPGKMKDHALAIAEMLLRDPMVGQKKLFSWFTTIRNSIFRRNSEKLTMPPIAPAKVIQREELILLLLGMACKEKTVAPASYKKHPHGANNKKPEKISMEKLATLLKETVFRNTPDVAALLVDIQKEILEQEKKHPHDAAAVWRSRAILEKAPHDFLAKIYSWYDNTIDRVKENFALEAKVVTALVALLACFYLQLDTFGLVKRLSTDTAYRNALVEKAKDYNVLSEDPKASTPQESKSTAIQQENNSTPKKEAGSSVDAVPENQNAQKTNTAVGAPSTPEAGGTAQTEPQQNIVRKTTTSPNPYNLPPTEESKEQIVKKLAEIKNLNLMPAGPGIFFGEKHTFLGIQIPKLKFSPQLKGNFPGILISWVLVALGVPFWFDLLKNVMGLRSLLAQKDDKDRKNRQEQQTEAKKP